jgi:hypothetical protein
LVETVARKARSVFRDFFTRQIGRVLPPLYDLCPMRRSSVRLGVPPNAELPAGFFSRSVLKQQADDDLCPGYYSVVNRLSVN